MAGMVAQTLEAFAMEKAKTPQQEEKMLAAKNSIP